MATLRIGERSFGVSASPRAAILAAFLIMALGTVSGAGHADEATSWTEQTSFQFAGPGTYNSSLISIFTDSRGSTVVDINGIRTSSVSASFNDNSGLVLLNQDAGNINNQANIQSYVLGNAAAGAVVDLASLSALLATGNQTVTQGGIRKNEITGSFQRSTGVVTVNQTAGNLNTQTNIFQFGLGVAHGPGAVALDDQTLATVNANNTGSDDPTTSKRDAITGNSFDQFRGVAQVTQSSGDQNAIRNTTTISVIVRTIK